MKIKSHPFNLSSFNFEYPHVNYDPRILLDKHRELYMEMDFETRVNWIIRLRYITVKIK